MKAPAVRVIGGRVRANIRRTGSLPGGGEHAPFEGKPEAAELGAHLATARFNPTGDTVQRRGIARPDRRHAAVDIDPGGGIETVLHRHPNKALSSFQEAVLRRRGRP